MVGREFGSLPDRSLLDLHHRELNGSQLSCGSIRFPGDTTQPNDDCWMSIANILVTAESSSLQDYLQNYQPEAWFHHQSA
jgi:hypothetical protein